MTREITVNGQNVKIEVFVSVFDKSSNFPCAEFNTIWEAKEDYGQDEYNFIWSAAEWINSDGDINIPCYGKTIKLAVSKLKKALQ